MAFHESAHVDDWPRRQLPPQDEWPVFTTTPPFDYPPRLNAVTRLLDDAIAEGAGDRVALVTEKDGGGWETLTYAALGRQVDALAHVLTGPMGLVPGNRVLLRGANGRWMLVAWLATLKAGLVAVTTMPLLRARELRIIIDRAQCIAALCDARLAGELEAAIAAPTPLRILKTWDGDWPDAIEGLTAAVSQTPFRACPTASDDVALIAFTSGSTGVPKGCMHFHRDVIAMCDGFSASVLNLGSEDRCVGTPPIAFTFGLGGLVCFPLAARASTVLIEKASPERMLEIIAGTAATVTFTAPTFYRQMALAIKASPGRFDTTSVRASVSAGEALPESTRTLWRETTGIEMLDGIGATELMHIFVAAAGRDVRPGAIGRAVPGYEVVILDEQCEPAPTGTVGSLAVRGPTGCRYLTDPRQRSYVRNGWNLTGDACTMDADGYVYFKARTDDLILSAGYNIGAPEVEAAVLEHPDVAECAVVGVPDVERGQVVKAFVVPRAGVAGSDTLARAIQDHVKSTIAPYKYPRLVAFVDALPKTDTGKLRRFQLKETT